MTHEESLQSAIEKIKTEDAQLLNRLSYDELISRVENGVGSTFDDAMAYRNAVYSVVKKHHPVTHLAEDDLWCAGCYPGSVTWPCGNIKDIFKELTPYIQ